jgi:adenine/guanine phosphoribosyltransferase-like PRPP-binding protein
MKRRDFFKTSFGAGLAAGAAYNMGGYDNLWTSVPDQKTYDMVAIMGGTPEAMFDIGIQELGGMGTFVKKGQKVLIVDDLLATGGTARATVDLVQQLGGIVVGVAVLVELTFLNGRSKLAGEQVRAVLQYQD